MDIDIRYTQAELRAGAPLTCDSCGHQCQAYECLIEQDDRGNRAVCPKCGGTSQPPEYPADLEGRDLADEVVYHMRRLPPGARTQALQLPDDGQRKGFNIDARVAVLELDRQVQQLQLRLEQSDAVIARAHQLLSDREEDAAQQLLEIHRTAVHAEDAL